MCVVGGEEEGGVQIFCNGKQERKEDFAASTEVKRGRRALRLMTGTLSHVHSLQLMRS